VSRKISSGIRREKSVKEITVKEITVGHYKTDNRSRYVYLGVARAKTIEMQPTELGHRLLDIIFEVPLEGQEEPCEFLIRLETYADEITRFCSMLEDAIENPTPHPWLFDLFCKAVTGMTPQEHHQSMMEKGSKNK
jgi:hypothetical protein